MDLGAVEAATRKHEAIETDIMAYGERVAAVEAVARELEAERYHDVRRVLARRDNVLRLWEYLRELLAARRERLLAHRDLQRLLQEMSYVMDWMADMKVTPNRHEWEQEVGGNKQEVPALAFKQIF